MEEEVQEEEGGRKGVSAGKGRRDPLGEDRERIEEACALGGQELRLGVPDHHIARPPADEEEADEHDAGCPGQRPRSPAPSLEVHPEGVETRRHEGHVRRVPVERADPAATPGLARDPYHGLEGRADPVEEDEVESGGQDDGQGEDGDGAGLIEGIEPPPIEAVGPAVEAGEDRPEKSLRHAPPRARFPVPPAAAGRNGRAAPRFRGRLPEAAGCLRRP